MTANNDNNLLQFLKKRNAFDNSPNQTKKSRSRSKQLRLQTKLTTSGPTLDQTTKDILYQLSAKNGQYLPAPRQESPIHNYSFQERPTTQTLGYNGKLRNIQDNQQNKQEQKQEEFWPQLVSYSQSFQAARIQATSSLQKMGSKLKNEIKSINQKINNFNSQIQKVIVSQVNNLKQKLLQIIEQVFKETQKSMQDFLKYQEQKVCRDLIEMRQFLQKQYKEIEIMKQDIAKTGWRKVTGKIIANQVQRKVNQIVKKSSNLHIEQLRPGELVGFRTKDFQRDLREALHLGKFK